MCPESFEIESIGGKTVRWQFRVENKIIFKCVESVEELRQETHNLLQDYSQEITIFVRDEGKYLNFDTAIDQIFEKQKQISIEFFYSSKKIEQQTKIQQLIHRCKMLNNQLDGKLENDATNLFNRLKISSRKSTHEESQYKRTVKICLLVADPLVTASNQPIYRQQLNIEAFSELINDSFKINSINIDLILQKCYLSKNSLKNLTRKHNNAKQYDALIIQIMTSIHQENGSMYLESENNEQYGMAQKMKLKELLEALREFKKLYFLMFVGNGAQILKTKSGYMREKINVPIFGVGTFDIKYDEGARQFLKLFYSNIFSRKGLNNSFEIAEKKIRESRLLNFTCCCTHLHDADERWQMLSKIMGSSIIHKLLSHFSYFALHEKRKKPWQTQRLVNIVLQEQESEKQPFNCYEDSLFKIHSQNKSEYCFKTEITHNNSFLSYPEDQEEFLRDKKGTGSIKGSFGSKQCRRQRPKVIYNIIKNLRKKQNMAVCIVGAARSGKYNAIRLAEHYVNDRSGSESLPGNVMVFENIAEQFEVKSTDELYKLIEHKRGEISSSHRLILKVNKILHKQKGKFEELINKVSNIPNFCFIASSENRLNGLQKCQNVEINVLTKNQIKYIILKQFSNKCYSNDKYIQKYIPVLRKILLKRPEVFKNIPFLDLAQFLKNLFSHHSVPNLEEIQSDIEHFLRRTKNMLDRMKKQNEKLWEFLGFISLFKEGFMMTRINETILKKMFMIENLTNQIHDACGQAKKSNIPLFYIIQFDEQLSYRRQNKWKILIQPENTLIDYFTGDRNDEIRFSKAKVKYFYYFFKYFLDLALKIQNSNVNEQKEGIFIFEIDDPKLEIKEMIQQFRSFSIRERKSIFRQLYAHHQFSYISFIKKISERQVKFQYAFISQNTEFTSLFLLSLLKFIIIEKIIRFYLPGVVSLDLTDTSQEFHGVHFNSDIYKLLQMFKANNVRQKILVYQNMALISRNCLKNIEFKGQLSAQEKIIKQVVIFEQNKNQIMRIKIRLQNLHHKIDKQSKSRNFGEEKKDLIDKVGALITQTIQGLKQLINSIKKLETIDIPCENLTDQLYLLILKLIIKKVIIKFENDIHTSPDHRHREFSHSILKEQLKEYGSLCQLSDTMKKQIQLCNAYFQEKVQSINNQNQLNFNQNQVSNEALELYKYIAYKINPKSLLENSNIILFMKSRCFTVRKQPCCFVRKGNIIKSFLGDRLQNRNINLFFLNLSLKNFQMVSTANTSILYLVLSVDTVKEGDSYKIIFEHSLHAEQQMIEYSKFIHMLQSIKFEFLILFGSKSNQLAKQIQADLKIDVCIFAFYLQRQYSLSTYPDFKGNNLNTIVTNYLENQNNHRVMELIACSLITFMVREQGNEITLSKLESIKNKAIENGQQVIKKWYRSKNVTFNNSFESEVFAPYSIDSFQSFSPKYFPTISEGKINDLTSAISIIPKNLVDDNFYEMVGRVQQLSDIINFLAKRKCLVQVLGKPITGKTQFLKEIGWFCQTRYVFGLGVYYFNMDKIREHNTSIMQYLELNKEESLIIKLQKNQRQFSSRNYILLLLDNLEQSDCGGENKQFFQMTSQGPISIVYSTTNDLRKRFEMDFKVKFQEEKTPVQSPCHSNENKTVENYHRRQLYREFSMQSPHNVPIIKRKSTWQQQKTMKPWQGKSININHIDNIELICIALTKIRNRNSERYEDILKSVLQIDNDEEEDLISSNEDEKASLLKETLIKIQQYTHKINSKGIYRNYLQYDSKKLLKMTDTVEKVVLKIQR